MHRATAHLEWRRYSWDAAIYLAIAAVTALHYFTSPHAHHLHDIYRRLYYLPIIVAAFRHGLAGGLLAGLVVCVAYLPHALGYVSHDPATDLQKALEMCLYLAVGLTTGLLVSRLQGTQRTLETTASELRTSLDSLRRTEEELLHAAKLAAVGRLSAGLAHEIRNPLASLKGSAEILADDFPAGHPKRRLLEVLVEESMRLNNVLSRFLAFARPQPPARTEVEVAPEVEGVVALLQGQREGRQVRFRLDFPESEPIRLSVDREQLRQVLLNILLNACQSAGENGQVWIRGERTASGCLIVVRDSGPGFSAEALANAFTPFFTTKPQGTGLGLAMSHRMIESHGGQIRLRNHEEGGGAVEMEIPRGSQGVAGVARIPGVDDGAHSPH